MTEVTNQVELETWRHVELSAGELYELFHAVSAEIKEAFAEAMSADEESSQSVKLSKVALFHQTYALETLGEAVKKFAQARTTVVPTQAVILHSRLASSMPICKAAGQMPTEVKLDTVAGAVRYVLCTDCAKVVNYYQSHGMHNPIPNPKTL